MSAVAQSSGGIEDRLGVRAGMVVAEFGYDEDVDHELRDQIAAACGNELVDEDYGDVVDLCLVWWREEDGDSTDLADALVDSMVTLEAGGTIWLLTPKVGRAGHVEASEVSEAIGTVGLSQTASLAVGPDWAGARLVPARGSARNSRGR